MSIVEESIIKSIEKNGFPQKVVSLPFKAIFSSCKKHGLKLAEVLEALSKREVFNEIGDEKILFYREKPTVKSVKENSSEAENQFGIPPDFMKTAMNQMKNMDPDLLKDLKEKVLKMSPQERSEMYESAKSMFSGGKNKN